MLREHLDSPTSEGGVQIGPNSSTNTAPVPRIGPTRPTLSTRGQIQVVAPYASWNSTLESLSKGIFPSRPLELGPRPVQGKERKEQPMKKNKEREVR